MIDLNFQGLALKKTGTKMRLNLNYRDGGLDFRKARSVFYKDLD